MILFNKNRKIVGFWDISDIFNDELATSSGELTCVCTIDTLMICGCKCGQIEREREAKSSDDE